MTLSTILLSWLTVEAVFVVVFYRVWLPRFQKLRPPEDYRGYSRDRRKLLCRILQRIEQTCRTHDIPLLPTLQAYVREWFQPIRSRSNGNDSKGNHGHSKAVADETFWPKRGDMDHFFAWAFFGKDYEDLDDWMHKDLQRMYETIESHYGLVFEPGTTPHYKAMRLSLDPLEPSYRPFCIYGLFSSVKLLAGLLLRAAGFYACQSSSGLMYFYRPARGTATKAKATTAVTRQRSFLVSRMSVLSSKDEGGIDDDRNDGGSNTNDNNIIDNNKKLPLIFLHGIAPGGLFFYIPMLFFLGGDGRPLLFFENPDISFYILGGYPPNEHDTVHGVWEAVDRHLGSSQEVSLVGHSFGSCPVTWLVHSAQKARIRQIVLVDPVSILLSEPDVIQNFLYQRNCLRKKKMPIKIGVVSNEIFTEHYLRRHFSWYNSELWLEDLPQRAKVLVCLSEEDSIVPSQKVQREMLRKPEVDVLVWENAGHAHCVTRPRTWRQMQVVMKRQEQMIFQEMASTPTNTTTTLDKDDDGVLDVVADIDAAGAVAKKNL